MNRTHKTLEREGKVADETIFYCEKCNRCWEATRITSCRKQVYGYLFHEDFPTYKKGRATCVSCSGEKLEMKKRLGLEVYTIMKS